MKSLLCSGFRSILIVLFLSLAFICSFDLNAQQASWTIMVYLDADNNLEPYGIEDLNEMELIGSTDSINVIVQFDRIDGFDITNGNWTGTKRYKVTQDSDPDNISSTEIQNLGEINMGDPANLEDFIGWAATNYPADHYALVLWNHGGGWEKSADHSKLPDKDVCYDDTDNDYLSNYEVSSAISAGSVHFDIIAYDACLMGMIEVAYQMRNIADYMVASEESIPAEGYDYTAILNALAGDQNMSAKMLTSVMVETYGNYYIDDVTLSAIDLKKVKYLKNQLDTLTGQMINDGEEWEHVGNAWMESTRFYDFVDIGDFASLLYDATDNTDIRQTASDLLDTLNSAVIYNFAPPAYSNATGLSVYFPEEAYYTFVYEEEDAGRDFADSSEWVTFLHGFFNYFFPDYTEPNNHFANATSLSSYNTTSGFLPDSTDIDIYRLFYPADEEVENAVMLTSDISTDMYLYYVNDTIVHTIDTLSITGSGNGTMILAGLDTGYYYLLVRTPENEEGSYLLYPRGDLEMWDWEFETPNTLVYDDGAPSENFEPSGAGDGAGMSFKGTGDLIGVWYYVTAMDNPNDSLKLHVYSLHDVEEWAENLYAHPEHTGWNYFQLNEDIHLWESPTIIGFSWEDQGISIGTDSASSDENSYQLTAGNWSDANNAVIYFIRPVFVWIQNENNDCMCSGIATLTTPSGSFSDGSNSENTGNACSCSWLVNPSGVSFITATIENLDLESCCDYLAIYDGNSTSNLIATLTGSITDSTITSSGDALLFEFFTDNSINYAGWDISYFSTIEDGITENNEPSEWSVFPNPGNGKIHLQSNSGSTAESIEIYDNMGQRIYCVNSGTDLSADISNYPAGIYFIRIITSDRDEKIKYILK